jgi:hypothetical protein
MNLIAIINQNQSLIPMDIGKAIYASASKIILIKVNEIEAILANAKPLDVNTFPLMNLAMLLKIKE